METKIPEQTELVDQIIDVIVSEGMVERDKVRPDATIESLGLKSIDIVMILTALEEKFDVYIPMDGPFHEAKDVKTLIDAMATYISKAKSSSPEASLGQETK
ncbi:acyl carrier protein [Methylovirgula sp. HY1]|uniref:acyl carrier protein n=1 Tax=Methylovirgula sp. HY1 TaxID=2822761 RepID=UPI001C5B7AC0|nr:phosphopantetheine-binding protein [Methylovirgula sp. HY1]QXX76403.1 Acyl carrier protein [Methylovirgula sp. HY1]